ncbi:hypothetical protein NBRC110019_04400 [Neptunitalea chrysea]|uniref:Lipoprotein n=1 Tax=Neptunitalea chrysea TaxID=1647581 RepID=A0A9W6B2Z9_9FLAO|nr:hypothetical protein [Neptunitalea chrysea]GLB51401.1 hypothetical protein NBRC110019_04400 [Neptunitalea chrysea]
MKKIFLISCLVTLLTGCDPEKCSSFHLANYSETNVNIYFVSQDTIIFKNIYQDSKIPFGSKYCDMGGGSILYMALYDSIYITDFSNNILKVYKEDTPGKNIYNIDEYWSVNNPSKHDYEYIYEINEEDFQ